MEKDLIGFIKKSHLKAVEKFNAELEAFASETGERPVTLYEDANISFTLSDVRISQDGQMFYEYDGRTEFEVIVRYDDEEKCYYEDDGPEGIMEYIRFWRRCLKLAKKFWTMDPDHLDAIQNGEAEFHDEDEED